MAYRTASGNRASWGFTLIELLVVMAIIATLLSIVAPRYFQATDNAREAALRANLQTIREAIDHFHGDRGEYPQTLDELVQRRYLRAVPVDPIVGNALDWNLVPVPAASVDRTAGAQTPELSGGSTGVYDVRSAAAGTTRDGVPFENL